MKRLWLIISFPGLFLLMLLSSCCRSDLHGDYLFDSLARQYLTDTSASFTMIDNKGFRESFVLQNKGNVMSMYQGGDLDRCGVEFRMQMFDLEYVSTINRYFFSYHVSASTGEGGPSVAISWGYDTVMMYATYYPATGEYYGSEYAQARVWQVDSMIIRGKTYKNILKISLEQGMKQWLLFFAMPEGLVKIIRPDGNYAERE